MKAVFSSLCRLIKTEGQAALVTVIGAKGSTPREAGARMIVTKAGHILGTVGGGRLELQAVEDVRAAMEAGGRGFHVKSFPLGPALGQCCGGHVTLGLEVFGEDCLAALRALADAEAQGPLATEAIVRTGHPLERRIIGPTREDRMAAFSRDGILREVFGQSMRRVHLFGAGHVGRAVMLALAPLPFELIWIDERRDMFPAAVPAHVRQVVESAPALAADAIRTGDFVLIMTHDHAADLSILHKILADERAVFVGLIGSQTKRARFETRLKDLGLPKARATAFRCPIGIPGIRSKEPAIIAASVAAELIMEDERQKAGLRPSEPLLAAVRPPG